LDYITKDIDSGASDLIISLGQDYLNHMVLNITKGIIPIPNDPSTKKDDIIKSGKKGVFYIVDEASAQGKIVLDILIKPNFFQSLGMAIATFRTKLYFPLIITPEISFELDGKTPTVVFKVKDIDMTEETLRKGLYGVATNLNAGISRKLVIKKIKQQLIPFMGSTIYKLPLKELEGLNLGKMLALSTDKMGRLNLKFKLEEVDEESRQIAKKIPALLHKLSQNKASNY
jgi:hypothetical protein